MFFRELETDRLFLKNISLEDRDFIYSQFSNAEVNRYLFDAEPLVDLHGADEVIRFYIQPEPRKQHRWILVRKVDGAKLGTCGFHCWEKSNGSCLEFARSDMTVKCIHACIHLDNHRSSRIVEKFGFVFKGKVVVSFFRGQNYPHRIFALDIVTERFQILFDNSVAKHGG